MIQGASLSVDARIPTLLAFCKFSLVGVGNTLTSYAVYAALVTAGLPYLLSAGIAFLAGAALGYSLNRRWTFRAPGSMRSRATYLAIQALVLAESLMLLWLVVDRLHAPTLAGQAIVLPLVAITGFAANSRWTFRRSAGSDRDSPAAT
jgi:putative flippase GtrA